MRKSALILVLVVAACGLLWLYLDTSAKRDATASLQTAAAAENLSMVQAIVWKARYAPTLTTGTHTQTSGGAYHFPLSEPPLPFMDNYGSPTTTGADDIAAVNQAMAAYLRAIPDNERPPTGTNAEFTRVLSGDNPLHVAFISQTHIVNGELTDRWGTPLSFHFVSGQQVDITSAGPDRKFFTSDDVTAPPSN